MKMMINYNYTLRRNEGDTNVLYVPKKIPTQLPNLVYIEGPNSLGKSTLLNIVALGINGLKNESINSALRKKMNALLESSHQQLSFEISIQNNDGSIEIVSEKQEDSKQIIVYENMNGVKKPISPEKLQREYNVIYDIPFNPIERIDQLTLTIKSTQENYGSRIALLRKYINQVIAEIKNAKNPEQILALKENIESLKRDQKELKTKLNANVIYLDILEKYTFINNYLEFSNQIKKAQNEIEKLKKKQTTNKRQISRKSNAFSKLIDQAKDTVDLLEKQFNEVTPKLKKILSKNQEQLIQLWELIDIQSSFKELTFNNKFQNLISLFKSDLSKLIKDDHYINTYEETEVIGKLITLLDEYKFKNIIIPGYGKKVSEFIDILKEEIKKQNDKATYFINIRSMIESLDKINSYRKMLEDDIFPRIREISKNEDWFEVEDFSSSLNDLQNKLKQLENELNYYEKLCIKKDIDISNIEILNSQLNELYSSNAISDYEKSLTEDQLTEKLSFINAEISKDEKDLKKITDFIVLKGLELERLESKEPHPYQEKLEYLSKLQKTCLELEQKFRIKYTSYIDNIINNKKYEKNDDDQKRYFNEVAQYLGKRIGEVRYIDNVYTAEAVDIIEGVIRTKEGKIIHLTDMGTGQSQSAYLLAQLNTSDNRKIIALFDEVAMMDKNSLEPIFLKMKELYEKGKLLVGIVVQKGDQVRIEKIEDILR
ncbi:hypothetical protein DRW41_05020 [Neobacillus piezotolerans]|uniref:Uncharacterized protein n=1 Tax=Neobacillus piezotolerans TaxID=2259171 RepID=A0A3D8GXJ4_9BACI|nr:hypothetical protein [Neobacillus piezotolerans]RDU38919.1 hypothetical protein DRW41_05020 [Neobacillus piezotolerans]